MPLESKIKSSLFTRVRRSLAGRIATYGLVSSLVFCPLSRVLAESVLLKDGSIIQGTITSQDDQELRIKTDYGELNVNKEKVKRIDYEKEQSINPKPERAEPKISYVVSVREKSSAVAGLLSLLIPGGGQFYNGQNGKGTGFLIAGLGCYAAGMSKDKKCKDWYSPPGECIEYCQTCKQYEHVEMDGGYLLGPCIQWETSSKCKEWSYPDDICVKYDEGGRNFLIAGGIIQIWSIIDAIISANRINKKSLEEKGLGLEYCPELNGPVLAYRESF